jgi:predicted phage-related endonuclease
MNKETFIQYAEIKAEMKELTERMREIEAEVKKEMAKEGVDKVKSDFGTFSLRTNITYTFSEKVDNLKEKLDRAKEKEVMSGVATIKTQSESLTFRAK